MSKSDTQIVYDPTVGLMPHIEALTAPPRGSSALPASNSGEVRRPRFIQNATRGSCDFCKEGGDLIACDKCSAMFHLDCHDPPLDNVPVGEWRCNKCRRRSVTPPPTTGGAVVAPEIIPLQTLIRAARHSNAKQYRLPKDISCPFLLPGTAKSTLRSTACVVKRSDQGVVSLPAKLCFVCARSCRVAPLLQCDFCPSLYHADCLDPPLTQLPTSDVWMCPNHVEHSLDGDMLTSTSLWERVRLWDQFGQGAPIDERSVQLKFLDRINRPNPAHRLKIRHETRYSSRIPASVRYAYAKMAARKCSVDDEELEKEVEELRQLIVEQHEEQQQLKVTSATTSGTQLESATETPKLNAEAKVIDQEEDHDRVESNADVVKLAGGVEKGDDVCDKGKMDVENEVAGKTADDVISAAEVLNVDGNDEMKSVHEVKEEKIDDVEMKEELAVDEYKNVDSGVKNDTSTTTTSSEVGKGGKESSGKLEEMDEDGESLLVFLKRDVFPTREDMKRHVESRVAQADLNSMTAMCHGLENGGIRAVRARALLCPALNLLGPTAPISYRTFTIGTSVDMDLCLAKYGHCNNVSAKHAIIFYDETSDQYELLNYSEFGTTVNDVLYSCDFTEKPYYNGVEQPVQETKRCVTKPATAVSQVREMLHKNKQAMNAYSAKRVERCDCDDERRPGEEMEPGWEGTALLHHGSLLQFGCLQFVFSVVHHNGSPDDE